MSFVCISACTCRCTELTELAFVLMLHLVEVTLRDNKFDSVVANGFVRDGSAGS